MFAMLEADEWIDRLDKPIVASLPSLSYPPPKRRNIYVHGCVKLGGVGTGTERAREPCDRLRDKKPITTLKVVLTPIYIFTTYLR